MSSKPTFTDGITIKGLPYMTSAHRVGGGEYPKIADKQYRADGVDGPQEMERN